MSELNQPQKRGKDGKPTNAEIIERLEKWFKNAKAYWSPHHERFAKIKMFTKAHGPYGQWDEPAWRSRSQTNPPRLTLTENLLGPFVNQVVNDLKKSDFGAIVKPKGSATNKKLAEVRQGLHRGIQQIGGFKAMLDQMADDLVTGGLGAGRLITKYQDSKSFQKEIEYMEVDPSRIFHGDGTNRKSDFSDVVDSLVYEPYSKEKFKQAFNKDPDDFLQKTDTSEVWGNKTTGPWVSEYFFAEEIPDTLVMFGKKEYYLSEFKKMVQDDAKQIGLDHKDLIAQDKDGNPITRETTRTQIWWCKLAGKEVLEVEAWPGLFIPNFVATGRKVMIHGEMKYYGLAEPAVDVQKAHNYAFSAMVERAGLAPKVRIFAAVESIPTKFQHEWDHLNTSDKMVAYYQAYDSAGHALPPPHQEPPISSDPAFAELRGMTTQGIRDVLGMWESSLGAQSREKSGVAIQTRERQADTGNYDWGASLAVTAEHCFVTTDEILNKVYDEPTEVRIVGEDDKEDVAMVYAAAQDGEKNDQYYDLNEGKYELYCKMAPSSDTKREEQAQGMQALFQGDPELASILAPEYVALQDWKGADKMSKILEQYRAMKYGGLAAPDDKQPQIPPQVQQKMQQMQQQMQQMGQQLQDAQKAVQENQALKLQNQNKQGELQNSAAQIEIERFNADTERMKVTGAIDANKQNMLLAADKAAHDAANNVAKLGHEKAKAISTHELALAKLEHDKELAAQAAEATAAQAGESSEPQDVNQAGSAMEG